jgi:iron complex outermembrane receptor protein
MKPALLLLTVLFCFTHNAFLIGQPSDSLAKTTVIKLDTLTVTAWGAKRPLLQTPSALTKITAVDLARDQDLQIAPILNRVAGLFMQSSNLTTNRLTIRGIGSRSLYGTSKIKAYWNEIPLSTAEVSTSIEDLDLSTIGQIEVIKGPASSLYGAGLGGTVLISPTQISSNSTAISQQTMAGSYGLLRSVTSFQKAAESYSIQVNYSHNSWEGYRQNNQFDRNNLNLFSTWKPSEKEELSFMATIVQLKAFIPSSINRDTYESMPSAAATNWLNARGFEDYDRSLFGLSYSRDINPKWTLKSSVFGSVFTNYEPRPFNILQEDQASMGTRTVVEYRGTLKKRSVELLVGTELFFEDYQWQTFQIQDQIQGALLTDQEENRSYGNVFVQSRLEWTEKLHFEAGLNVNRTRYQREKLLDPVVRTDDSFRFEQVLSPRLAANYLIKPNQSVYVALAHGFSPPTVQETLDPDGQINPNIRPEEGWNMEVGSRGTFLAGRLFYDIALYRMLVKDLLVARRTAEDQFVGINAGGSLHRGVELELNYQFTQANSPLQVQLFTTATLNAHRFETFVDGDQDYSGNELTGVPNQVWNTGLDFSHAKSGFYGNITGLYVGKMPMKDDNSIYSEAYILVNSRIGIKRKIASNFQLNCYTGLQNLFDEKYASQILINAAAFGSAQPRYYYPGLPRNTFIGLNLRYSI